MEELVAVPPAGIHVCSETALAGLTPELFADDEHIKAGIKPGGEQKNFKNSCDKEIREEVSHFRKQKRLNRLKVQEMLPEENQGCRRFIWQVYEVTVSPASNLFWQIRPSHTTDEITPYFLHIARKQKSSQENIPWKGCHLFLLRHLLMANNPIFFLVNSSFNVNQSQLC